MKIKQLRQVNKHLLSVKVLEPSMSEITHHSIVNNYRTHKDKTSDEILVIDPMQMYIV